MKICMYKKLASILLCLLCFISFTGCSIESQLVGTWELASATYLGKSIDVSDVYAEIQLNADGSAGLRTEKASLVGEWSYDNGTLTIDDLTGSYANNTLAITYEGVYMEFTKK